MANRRREPVSYRPFRADPLLPDGLLGIARAGGELESKVADFMFRIAGQQADIADRVAERRGERAGRQAALAAMPQASVPQPSTPQQPSSGGGRSYRTNDPVATNLPPYARAFLNAVAGGESGGRYDIRYTPKGGATFKDFTRHPGIMEAGPHGPSSAAGRYQFTRTTWDSLGGGAFTPERQDQRAWDLAQQRYRSSTGKDLAGDLQSNGLTAQILGALTPTWQAFQSNKDRHIATYQESLARYGTTPQSVAAPGLTARPALQNADGTISTEQTITIDVDVDGKKRWLNIPTIVNGQKVSDEEAIELFESGQNQPVGEYDSVDSAERAARERSAAIGRARQPPGGQTVASRPSATGARFQPTNRDTISGRAYDAAGTRTFLQILDTEIRSTTSQAFDLYSDDPAALNQVLDTLKAQQLRDHVPEELQAEYELAFETERRRYLQAAGRKAEEKIEQQNLAAFQNRTNEIGTDLERRLVGLDPNAPETAGALHSALTAFDDHYDAGVANGLITPTAAEEMKRRARRDTAVSFYQRQADALNPGDIEGYRQQLEEDFASGNLDGVDGQGWQLLDSRLKQMATGKQAQQASSISEIDKRGSELADRAAAGFTITTEELNSLVLDSTQTGDPETVPSALAKISAAQFIREMPLDEAAAYVRKMREDLPASPSPAQLSAVAYAEQRLQTAMQLIETDPAGYAIATGNLKLEPINLENGETMAASLALRRDQMDGVAARYGANFTMFRPGETATLAKALTENPEAFPEFASALTTALGSRAPQALAEISEDAPVLAHAAGIAAATGDQSVARELAQAISEKRQGTYTVKMPTTEKFNQAAQQVLGTSTGMISHTRTAVLGAAALIFEREANIFGFDPADVGKDGTDANLSMQRAINRALGGRTVNGEKLGGLGDINGQQVILPTSMSERGARNLVQSLSESDLEALPKIRTGNGIEITPRQLRNANLVTVGDGLYRVALGDPFGYDPQYVVREDGSFWTLDLNLLATLRRKAAADRAATPSKPQPALQAPSSWPRDLDRSGISENPGAPSVPPSGWSR